MRSTQKLPIVRCPARDRPRINAIITAMPAAADTNCWTVSPTICVRWLMVFSPPYDCQFVLVMKLTAVLNDNAGATFTMSVGLNGRSL